MKYRLPVTGHKSFIVRQEQDDNFKAVAEIKPLVEKHTSIAELIARSLGQP